MTDPEAEPPRMVPMISVTGCPLCRRARGAAIAGSRGPQAIARDGSGRCTHGQVDRTIWAPGEGPDPDRAERAERDRGEDGGPQWPEDSGWDTRPDGPV